MNQISKDLALQAKVLAETIKTDLTSDDLTELLLLINWDWPTSQDKYRMAQLLAQIAVCWDYAPIKVKALPNRFPFPFPYDSRDNAPFLVAKLRRAKSDKEKIQQLVAYLFNGREEDILVEMLRKGPENVVYADLPPLVTHALITRKLKPRLLRILEDRDERIKVKWPNG